MRAKSINVGAILFGIFCLLIVSICIALYLGATEERQKSKPIEGQATVKEMADYLKKLNTQIGKRDIETPEGQKALRQTASMIEGTLGPLNLGYDVSRASNDVAEGFLWTTLWFDAGNKASKEITVIAIPYGKEGTPVAFGLGFAEYLVGAPTKNHVRVVFYPPVAEGNFWEEVIGDDEVLVKQIDLLGGAGHNTWANLYLPEEAKVVLKNPAWLANTNVLGPRERLTIELSVKGPMKTQQQADRLLRMMPVVRALAE
ncbi:hypothetical protein OAE58_02340 [Akkermansiaceae bacterium]|nr:hypothetical protein [Akkermansiaceae bacterium]MDB4310840.1 hypothetical protein [bacterium]MDA7651056.1 hypothetical protein [Akkermansiaceae bacterium]MDA7683985.1 hypothetical protein [Akkermansiaceae bacterium]MDA7864101.1 hypothetical protein [Akkermansiaceae bacterium]